MPSYDMIDNKIILRIRDRVCANEQEIVESDLFHGVVENAINKLVQRRSILLEIFDSRKVTKADFQIFFETMKLLIDTPADDVIKALPESARLLNNRARFNDVVEHIYNYWRSFDRFFVTPHQDFDHCDEKPYRIFNSTIGHLTALIRNMYRNIQENVTGRHPRIYRQVAAGAEVSTIAIEQEVPLPKEYQALNKVPMMRQILLVPPFIMTPPMNKRSGRFAPIQKNPLVGLKFDSQEWFCYPAKVGELVILIYFHNRFAELGFSLCNLFQMAEDEDLNRQPDAVFAYGVPSGSMDKFGDNPTVFFDDEKNGLFAGAVPVDNEFGYFGYLKKMVLTLHNVIMMKRGILPYHGALIRIVLKGDIDKTCLFMGDTGTGKSETLEAFRALGDEYIQDLVIIADDMGSVKISPEGKLMGYGTEIGAFLRLDDLQPGYALGQIDRAIIMSASQVNARIILPVTTYDEVIKGEEIDFILYANNYDDIDDEHPIVERFDTAEKALNVFREGTAMSKGTTTSQGLVHSYFANIFGPAQFKNMHDDIARRYFEQAFQSGVFIGQMRTRLGIPGWEQNGPEAAAKELFRLIEATEK